MHWALETKRHSSIGSTDNTFHIHREVQDFSGDLWLVIASKKVEFP